MANKRIHYSFTPSLLGWLWIGLVTLLCSFPLYAQKEANIWWFGRKAGLDFNTSPPTPINSTIPIFTYEGSACISDPSTGQLIFATDGTTVWYPDGSVVPGGTGLKGNFSSAQSALIVPNPSNSNQWFIFTANVNPPNGTPYGHNYYVVNRTGSTLSVGGVNPLLGSTVSTEQLAALGDGAGGYWVMAHGVGNNTFYAFNVSASGTVNSTPVVTNIGTPIGASDYISSMKVNTCQTKLALTNLGAGIMEVYNFNNSTGQVTSLQYSITGISQPYGLEFSPNDAYLYYGTLGGNLYQLDMSTGISTLTGWTPPPNGVGNFGQLQLGPDGKIYVASETTASSSYLGVITAPNNPYTTASYSNTGIQISPVNSYYSLLGLPTFSRTFVSGALTAYPSSGGYCINTDIPLSYSFTGAASSQTWSVAPAAGWSFTTGNSNSSSPTIRFSSAGTYTVQLDVVSCGRTYTQTLSFTITSPLSASGTASCSSPDIILDNPATDPNEPLYLWYDGPSPTGKLIGIGTPVNYTIGNDASKPSNVYVEVASSANISASGSNAVGPAASALTWSAKVLSGGYTSPAINVYSDILILKSFDVYPRTGYCSGTLNVVIKNGSGTTLFTNSYTPSCIAGVFTVPVNYTLTKGNNYTIVLTSPTMQLNGNPSATSTFTTSEASLASASAGNLEIAHLVYDYNNFTVSTTCSNRTPIPILCSLPVELISFTGQLSDKNILLQWSTASEIKNHYFEVERSEDGYTFYSIGRQEAGNNKGMNMYQLKDMNPSIGTNYYRLVQYDLNGAMTNSDIIAVYYSSSKSLFTLFPNPSNSTFKIFCTTEQAASYSISNILGQIIEKGVFDPKTHEHDLGTLLPRGSYLLTVTTQSESSSVQLIKE